MWNTVRANTGGYRLLLSAVSKHRLRCSGWSLLFRHSWCTHLSPTEIFTTCNYPKGLMCLYAVKAEVQYFMRIYNYVCGRQFCRCTGGGEVKGRGHAETRGTDHDLDMCHCWQRCLSLMTKFFYLLAQRMKALEYQIESWPVTTCNASRSSSRMLFKKRQTTVCWPSGSGFGPSSEQFCQVQAHPEPWNQTSVQFGKVPYLHPSVSSNLFFYFFNSSL